MESLPLLIVLIAGMRVVFVVIGNYIDSGYLERINRNNLQVHPALIALDRLAFLHLIGINDNRVIAFRTYNSHDPSSVFFGSPTVYRLRL